MSVSEWDVLMSKTPLGRLDATSQGLATHVSDDFGILDMGAPFTPGQIRIYCVHKLKSGPLTRDEIERFHSRSLISIIAMVSKNAAII